MTLARDVTERNFLPSQKARQVNVMHCHFVWVCMYVCMYISRLRNAILCLCMYIRNACTIQSYARVCISVTLAQLLHNSVAKMCPGPRLLPGLCGPYLMEEHNKPLPRSLRIAYDFSNALKIHLNVCRVCCALNDQIQ